MVTNITAYMNIMISEETSVTSTETASTHSIGHSAPNGDALLQDRNIEGQKNHGRTQKEARDNHHPQSDRVNVHLELLQLGAP
jgi:hypothetical protein